MEESESEYLIGRVESLSQDAVGKDETLRETLLGTWRAAGRA